MRDRTDRLLARIDGQRAAQRTLELLGHPSPSGDERAVAELYATMLDDLGMTVELDEQYPESPSVVARSPGGQSERVLQLSGHLDTIANPHAQPALNGDVLIGRGAADMKSGLAAILELVQAFGECELLTSVSLLVTAYGQHEEPVGGNPLHAPLIGLLRRGVHGTACLIPEGPHRYLPISGRGLVIFEMEFLGPDQSSHEILGEWPADRNPVMAAVEFAERLKQRSQQWTLHDEYAGDESFFLGRIAGGDLYNRVPVRAVCEGTRRYPHGRSYAEVRDELLGLAHDAAKQIRVACVPHVVKSGQPFRLDEDEPIVRAVLAGHERATGASLRLGSIQYSADASQVMEYARVPAVYHGVDSTTAHSDHECVEVSQIERCARVLVATAAAYIAGTKGMAPGAELSEGANQ